MNYFFILPISQSTRHLYHNPCQKCRNRRKTSFEGRAKRGDSRACETERKPYPPTEGRLQSKSLEWWEAIKEAELEEIADAEVGKGAEVGRKAVVFRFARISTDPRLHTRDRLLCFWQ